MFRGSLLGIALAAWLPAAPAFAQDAVPGASYPRPLAR
jgi:hypothetical protein